MSEEHTIVFDLVKTTQENVREILGRLSKMEAHVKMQWFFIGAGITVLSGFMAKVIWEAVVK